MLSCPYFKQRTVPVLCNLTTGSHSSRGLKVSSYWVNLRSQRWFLTHLLHIWLRYNLKRCISPSHFPCLLSMLISGRKQGFPAEISLSFLLLIWREDGKLRRKGNEGHLWRVSCEFICHLCPAELLFGLLQQDFKLLRTSCCCNAETTINITCEVCRLSGVWFCYLPSLCCVLICTVGGFVKEHKHTGGAVWWQNVAGGKTVGTPSHCPQWLPLSFPHTHTCYGKEAIVTQTHWTHYLRGWPFF